MRDEQHGEILEAQVVKAGVLVEAKNTELRGGEVSLLQVTGRISRMQYFVRAFPASFVIVLLQRALEGDAPLLALLVVLVGSAFVIIQGVKRLHDLNLSGWWGLIGAIPIVGVMCGLVVCFTQGTAGPNRFGPDPLTTEPAMPARPVSPPPISGNRN